MLNKSGDSGHPCFLPDLRGKAFNLSLLSVILAVSYHIYTPYFKGYAAAAAAAAKSLPSCPTLCDPIDGAHQIPPSLGFSRQEYWSGVAIAFSDNAVLVSN